jgi:TP901 family phage tail tape measure protein
MPLPPVTQEYLVNATDYLAGVDKMIETTTQLAASIDEALAAASRMSAGFDAAAGADDRLAAAGDAAAAAADRVTASVDGLAATFEASSAAADANTAALDANTAALDGTAASADGAAASTTAFGSHAKLAFLGIAAAVGFSVVKAAEFQSSMTKLNTQAGVSKSKLGALGQGVLKLAGQVGEGPQSLAESLYHVESNFASMGITSAKAMGLVKIAAEGAQVGGADLVDVTNALTAAVASGIPGVQNMSQAMGALNAIVGAGDMQMQDLADAFGTGMVAVVKGYGLSLKDVGAALDVFGDNNIRGAKAGTDLRMSVQSMAIPMATAAPLLAKLGMNSQTLAKDMQSGGLLKALDDFTARLHKAGVTSKEQGQYITGIFGKKAGAGLSVLLDQMDRLRSKYPAIDKGAKGFGDAWKTTSETVQQRFKDFKEGLDALAISFGTVLLPTVTKVMGVLDKFLGYLQAHPALAKFAGALVAVAVAMGIVEVAGGGLIKVFEMLSGGWIVDAIGAIGGAVTGLEGGLAILAGGGIVAAIVALGVAFYELYRHSKTVRDAVADVGHFFESVWKTALAAAGAVVHWFVSGPLAFIKQELAVFSAFWKKNGAEIEKIVKVAWDIIATAIKVDVAIIKGVITVGLDVIKTVWNVAWAIISNTVKTVWNVIAIVVRTAIRVILDVITVVLDVLQGHWSDAWNHIKDIAGTLLHATVALIKTIASGFGTLLWDAGKALLQGLVGGIKAMWGTVVSEVKGIAGGIVSTFKSALKIFSPSKVMEDIGLNIGRGLVRGLEGSASSVKSAASKLATYVREAFNAKDITEGTAQSLTSFIERDNERLQTLANKRNAILKEIAAAKKYASSTASSVESWAGLSGLSSVTTASSAGGGLYSGDMLADLQSNLATIKSFEAALKKLKTLGLNKNLLNQIIQMGPQQGLQVAEALINGPASVIKSMDQTQNQITKASNQLGKTAADEMYDSGKQAGKGFLSGLEGQQKAIEQMMKKIARSMVDVIRRELGIRSPSTVARYHGQMWSEGLALGIEDGTGRVSSAAGKATRALSAPARGSASTAAGEGSGNLHIGPINVTVHGFVGDNRQLATQIFTTVQEETLRYNKRNSAASNGLSLTAGRFG